VSRAASERLVAALADRYRIERGQGKIERRRIPNGAKSRRARNPEEREIPKSGAATGDSVDQSKDQSFGHRDYALQDVLSAA
jgi:hypothetical protein